MTQYPLYVQKQVVKNKGAGKKALFVNRLQNRIFAVCTLVDNIDFTGIGIGEHEERVSQQIHLQNCFVQIHGVHYKLLVANDFVICFDNRFFQHAGKCSFFQFLFNTSFVLANLANNLIDGSIQSSGRRNYFG